MIRRSLPDPEADTATHRRFVDAGVDTMQVALRSSTHLEWTYIPHTLPASSEGERVAMHYTLAWMDRYVKADPEAATGRAPYAFDGHRCDDMRTGC